MTKHRLKSVYAVAVRIALTGGCLLLFACAWQPTVDDPAVAERVRAPEGGDTRGLQVYPLRNPAVAQLSEAAREAEKNGDLARAEMLLERALRIEPRDPELLQHRAELALARGDFEQAEHYAGRSWEVGPQVGDICRRNWQTLGLARERQGEMARAAEAFERVEACRVEAPPRY